MITEFSVQNFGCLGVKIEMTPIHALVGPNDSGKTTVLLALSAALRRAKHRGIVVGDDLENKKTIHINNHQRRSTNT